MFLKQSTTVTVRIGPFVDATDGVSEETGLGSMGIEISKNHGAFASRNSATATAHDAEGWYSVELDATDTGTLGPLVVKAHASATHLPVWREFVVVPAHVYDGLVAGTDNLQVDAVQIEGGDATDAINAACDTAVADYDGPTKAEMDSAFTEIKGATFSASTDTLEAIRDRGDAAWVTGSAPTAGDIADAVWDEAQSGHVGSGTFGEIATEIAAILDDTDLIDDGTSGLAKIATDVAAILVDTSTTLQGELDGIQADTEDIQSRLPAALVSGRIDASVGALAAGVIDATAIAADAITAAKLAADVSAEIADAVWDEDISGHLTAGSAGDTLDNAYNTASLAVSDTASLLSYIGPNGADLSAIPWNPAWDAEVQSECADALSVYDPPTKTEQDAAFTEIKGATWSASTDTLEAIRDRGDAAWVTGTTPPTASAIAAAVLAEAVESGLSVQDVLSQINAFAAGKIVKSGTTYAFYASDGTTVLYTHDISSSQRTVS